MADSTTTTRRGGPRAGAWVYLAFCLLYGAAEMAAFTANGMRVDLAARNALNFILPESLLGLLVLRLPRALPWPATARGGFYATHLGLLVAFIALSSALWSLIVGLDAWIFDGAFKPVVALRALIWRPLTGTLVYSALAGAAYAVRSGAAVREQAERAARAEALRARAELAAMRSQLNPHFILNTLHALVGLVRRDPALAESAIERLGDLLRYGLRVHREGIDEVTLRDEWTFVRSYLAIEEMRLGDRLKLQLEIDEASLDCRLPCFALQTLVENAVRHAIGGRAAGGALAIRAAERSCRLRVEVEDDGPGARWEEALAGNGLGLRLLHERVAVLYHGEGLLTLGRAEAGGAAAVLEVPCRRSAP